MPQNTSRWALTYWLFGDRNSLHGATQALADTVDKALTQVNSLVLLVRGEAADARNLNGSTSSASSDTDVGTAALDLGGASLTLPAGVGATVVCTYAVECSVWNALSVFTGSLRVTRLSDGTAVRTEPRPVVWAPGVAVPRITLTTTYTIPPEDFGRGLQLSAIKTNNNAAFRVLASLTKITVIQHRSGTAA